MCQVGSGSVLLGWQLLTQVRLTLPLLVHARFHKIILDRVVLLKRMGIEECLSMMFYDWSCCHGCCSIMINLRVYSD